MRGFILEVIVKRFQSCVLLYGMETWQVNLDWEHQVTSLAKRFTSGDWQLRGNYVQRFAIVTKFKGLEGANR